MKNKLFKNIEDPSSFIIANEAMRIGIKVKHINDIQKEMAFLKLSYKDHTEYIVSRKSSKTTSTADYAARNKTLTKSILSEDRISIAKGKLFHKDNLNDLYSYVKKIKYPVVIKKNDGAHGELVFVNINNKKKCEEKVKEIIKENDYVLVEKMFGGEELRFIASRKKIFSVTYRESANIVGDGTHNIKELIEIKNKDQKRGKEIRIGTYSIKIELDDDIKKNIKKRGFKLETIMPKGKKIYLRDDCDKNSIITNGGDSVDVTDIVHKELKKIVIKSVCAIPGLPYAGVDIITKRDFSKKPIASSYIVLEINASPAIYPQHFPSIGKARNIAKEILFVLFPEIKNIQRYNNKK